MTAAMAGILAAVVATSAVCYALMTRAQSRRFDRPLPRASSESGGLSSAGDVFSLVSSIGHLGTESACHHFSDSIVGSSGGWDGGGAGDCDGGGGGGGGDGG